MGLTSADGLRQANFLSANRLGVIVLQKVGLTLSGYASPGANSHTGLLLEPTLRM